jgi:5-methylcytosine-specific restriction protein A
MTHSHAFHTNERKPLTDLQRARLFLEKKGRCHRCTRKIMHGEPWYDEHVQALQNSGTNDWENRDLTCKNCFPKKNAEDAAKAAKTRAVATNHIIPASQRQKRGPPMPGSRRSAFKKKLNGETVRR